MEKKKKKKKTKSEKRRRLFLHDGALALASKVSSRYCVLSLLHRRCLSPVLTSVPEWRYFSVVLRYTNNHHHPYIDSTTVLSDSVQVLANKARYVIAAQGDQQGHAYIPPVLRVHGESATYRRW